MRAGCPRGYRVRRGALVGLPKARRGLTVNDNIERIGRMTSTMRSNRFAFALALVSTFTAPAAFAQPANDAASVEDMRREIKQLKAQVQTLQAAVAEVSELTRQSSEIWARALRSMPQPSATEGASAPRGHDDAPHHAHVPEAKPALQAKAGVGAAARRREVAAPVPTGGTVRGKVEVPSGEPVAYAYVENVFASPVKGEKVAIEQKDKQFVPSWAVVQRGTTVSFPNMDKVYHNVFSLSSGNSFDLGLYNSAGQAKAHTFNEPGAVDVFCNIHPHMAASVLVVPNRHFAKIKADGSFEIADVPSGKRKVVVWAPGARLATQWVELEAGGTAQVALKLEAKSRAHKNKQGHAYGSYE